MNRSSSSERNAFLIVSLRTPYLVRPVVVIEVVAAQVQAVRMDCKVAVDTAVVKNGAVVLEVEVDLEVVLLAA
jgi:hypothetical protein